MSKKKYKNTSTRHPVDEYSEIMRQEKSSSNHFKAFMPKPQRTHFDSQAKNEKIILVLRQHPVTLLGRLAILFAMILAPFIFNALPLGDLFPTKYVFALNLGWYMLVFGFILETFLIWFYSVYLITDERVIDVDFVSLLFKNVSTAKIDSIQDISSKTSGILASIVDYGTIYIQTAGEQRELQFENVPQPAKVSSLLNELIIEEEQEKIEGRVS